MRRTLTGMVLGTLLTTTGLLTATSAAAAGGPLAGTWTSVDTDGSNQTLDIAGSGARVYSMVYVDDAATDACGGDPARITGPGHVEGDGVVMVGTLTCSPGGNPLRHRIALGFAYDGSDDTLTDDFGIVWHRTG